MSHSADSKTSRRRFLHQSTCGAVGGVLASQVTLPAAISARSNAETLRIGLIGCGGRGTGAALNALKADPHVELTAMADLFDEKIQSSLTLLRKQVPDKVNVDPARCFAGFDAYQRLMESDVDVVLLTTPPGFRAEHLRAAVQAGKHSFVEITIAVDAPGVRSALGSSQLATEKNLAVVSGFCWRYNDALRAAAEQIRQGAIGDIRSVYAT